MFENVQNIRQRHNFITKAMENWKLELIAVGLANIEDSFEGINTRRHQNDYIKKSKERLITAASKSNSNIRTNRKTKRRKEKWEKKTTVWIFQMTNWRYCTRKVMYMDTKGKIKRETETQKNAIKKINNTQQNSKSMLCKEKDEMVNHIISEGSKLTQKGYKTRYDD